MEIKTVTIYRRHPTKGTVYRISGLPLTKGTLDSNGLKYAHSEVMLKLIGAYHQRNTGNPSFKLNRQMVKAFASHVSDFHDWLAIQLQECDNQEMLNFIYDTVVYLNGGNRQMAAHLWNEVISLSKNDKPVSGLYGSNLERFNKLTIPTTEQAVLFWMKDNKSISDFYETMNVLFGE